MRQDSGKHMDEEYQIAWVDKPAWGSIGQAISNYNLEQAGDDRAQALCFVLHSPDQVMVGVVIGATYGLQIDLMLVKEELRGRGYGHRLLARAEQEARQRGARNAYLDTFSFQTPVFYPQHSYRVIGELPDFCAGH